MVFICKQKQALSAACDPLRDAGILQHTFTFLPGSWLFLGAVCSELNALYAGIGDQQVSSVYKNGRKKIVICGSKSTLCLAAVATPAAARLACECGLQICTEKTVQLVAGLYADIETLGTLKELGMPFSKTVVEAVALSGRLNVLQHLISEQRCPISHSISHYAARSGSIDMLKWLKAQSWCKFDFYACVGAAQGGHLAALQYVCRQACDREADQVACHAASSGCIEVVEWLRQQQGVNLDARVLTSAASAGQIAMCEHLRSIGCNSDEDTCYYTASAGHLGTLRWLR
jgi:hypothetical protein